MSSADTLSEKIQMLPPAARKAVIDLIENLLEGSGNGHGRSIEDDEWSEFSLTQAMAGLEDEAPYTEQDLKEKWR